MPAEPGPLHPIASEAEVALSLLSCLDFWLIP